MSAKFTDVDKLRFWCQKVLPLVYDDSLSYYELLCKVVEKLNVVIENIDNIPDYIGELISEDKIKPILDVLVDGLRSNIAVVNEHDSTTATGDRTTGQLLWWKDNLYEVVRPMNIGDAYIDYSDNPNIKHVTIEVLINNLRDSIIDIIQPALEKLKEDLNKEVSDRKEAIDKEVSDREEAIDEEIQARIEADNLLQSNIDTEEQARIEADNFLQSNIDTEEQARITAINALQDKLDDEKTERKLADEELHTKLKEDYVSSWYKGKKILILGDSISDPNNGIDGTQPVWATYFTEKLKNVASKITNISLSGRKMIELPGVLQGITDWDYDTAIVFLGVNDFSNSVPLGNYGSNYYTYYTDAIRRSYELILNNIFDRYRRKADIYFITPIYHSAGLNSLGVPAWFYNAPITGFCKRWGCKWINGYNFPMSGELYSNWALVDGVHPRSEYAKIMSDYIIEKIANGGDTNSYNDTTLFLPLENKLTSMNGKLKAYLENEVLHIKGTLNGTPNGTLIELTSEIDFLHSIYEYNLPFIPGISFDETNGVLPALIFSSGNKLYANVPYTSFVETAIQFDYYFNPEWCNIGRYY